MKKYVVFILGFVSGAAVLFLVLLMVAAGMKSDSHTTKIPGLTLFDQAGEVMTSPSYEVLQVVGGGNALANASSGHGTYFGMVVLFLVDEGVHYYDDQIIEVPQGKFVRQVGTYQYPTQAGSYKTVPAVKICDR